MIFLAQDILNGYGGKGGGGGGGLKEPKVCVYTSTNRKNCLTVVSGRGEG